MSESGTLNFSVLLGKTIVALNGCVRGSNRIEISTVDGRKFALWHASECCETVQVEDVCGDPSDLLGVPLLLAEVVSNEPHEPEREYSDANHTWTFYKFVTLRGAVTIRWLGESNGYYSEAVTFSEEPLEDRR